MKPNGYKITDQFAIYFVTFTIVKWVDVFSRLECKQLIINSLKYCCKEKGLNIYAYVIMSNHLHLIISAEENSKGVSAIIRDFKSYTSKAIISWLVNSNKESRKEWMLEIFRKSAKYGKANQNYQLWKQRSHPIILFYPKFIFQKLDYIHMNPVVAGIVEKPEHYCFSSAQNYIGKDECLIDIKLLPSI